MPLLHGSGFQLILLSAVVERIGNGIGVLAGRLLEYFCQRQAGRLDQPGLYFTDFSRQCGTLRALSLDQFKTIDSDAAGKQKKLVDGQRGVYC